MVQNKLHSLLGTHNGSSDPQRYTLYPDFTVEIYPRSIHRNENVDFFIAKKDNEKYLFGVAGNSGSVFEKFSGKAVFRKNTDIPETVMQCPLTHENAVVIQDLFTHTRPRLIGPGNSIGLGDRIGLANPGHLQAVRNSGFQPVLAQQSIRELTRTNRTPEEVMDAATWAVFQEGYKNGFGADADHLKTTDDIDLMVRAGFTWFTIDPGEYVVNEAADLSEDELLKRAEDIEWNVIKVSVEECLKRYSGRSLEIDETFKLTPSRHEVLQAIVKYGNVVAHVVTMNGHIKTKHAAHPSEIEVSVDETDSPTTLFEHYFIVNELKRLGVDLVSLAPRFVGDFEKGIDYRGDIEAFTVEYKKHLAISERLGPYKMSIHSGSDKFTVYEAIGNIGKGHVHVKTAGTSYLEALRVVSVKEPDLFRDILTFSRDNVEKEKRTYHVSGTLEKVPDPRTLEDHELVRLFENDDARQVLHVAFGKVLTSKDQNGRHIFKDQIISCLRNNEELHYRFINKHFRKHIEPFGNLAKQIQSSA
jgi:tagaturonate epimerase